jgi:hypothetical protein
MFVTPALIAYPVTNANTAPTIVNSNGPGALAALDRTDDILLSPLLAASPAACSIECRALKGCTSANL